MPGDSCVTQLLSITHEIYNSFNYNPSVDIRGVLLESVWYRVLLNGQTSSWKNVLAGVLQGSVLGPLLFLNYINDLPGGLTSICKIFPDDTSLFSKLIRKNLKLNLIKI